MTVPTAQGPFPEELFKAKAYDPEPDRESVRGRVTLAVAFTFFAVVAFYLIEADRAGDDSWPRIKEAMQAVLPAVTSVLGTALGFYFGSQKR